MAFSHTLYQQLSVSGRQIAKTTSKSGGASSSLSETIPDSSTDLEVAFSLDVSACVSFYMVSDQDLTIETNDGSSPDDTISLTAGVPYIWHSDSVDAFQLGTDVTSLFVTNASGSDALLQVEALTDPTP